MTLVTESVFQRRRGSRSQLSFQADAEHDVLAGVIDKSLHNSRFLKWRDRIFYLLLVSEAVTMHRSTKTALIAISILVCVIVVILLLNLESIKSSREDACVTLDGGETCHSTDAQPYRFYGTKTAYHIATEFVYSEDVDVGACIPKVFYLLSRHATRYPDKDDIKEMIKLLPDLKKKISNNSRTSGVQMCEEDLKRLENWVEKMKPDDDNRMSTTGELETVELGKRYKKRFPSLLGGHYSPKKFVFEFTSRERTRSTAESFAKGLFDDDDFKKINFENSTNDSVLQFHKDCKVLQKKCKFTSYDTSEIDKFENSTLMQKVIDSVSTRIGVPLTYDQIKIILKACVFGYAVDIGDAWCSLFSRDELEVLEFGDDIDDYYKDAYGNKINHDQACPAVEFVMDLFKSYQNTSESKAVMHFSHAGGVKKVFSIFGLFKDEKPLTADNFCSQQGRRWRSSIIAPFLTNIAFVLYDCGGKSKIIAYHNEKTVKLDGCDSPLCSYEEFYKMYNPIAEQCDINRICSTCRL